MEKIFDVCIIGAGPAGIFTALQLMNDYKVLLLEMGNNYSSRQHCYVINGNVSCNGCNGKCSIISGFGGAFSSKSGGTLSLYPAGSSLIRYYNTQEELEADYEKALMIWREFSKDNLSFEGSTDEENIISFSKIVNQHGGVYKHYNGYKLTKDVLDTTMMEIEKNISDRVELRYNTEVRTIMKVDKQWELKCTNGNIFSSKTVVFATGRKGNSFTSKKLKNLGISYKKTGIDLGVRLELSKDRIDHLAKLHPDIKIRFNINGEEVRTFCFCPAGRIVHFNQDSLYRTKSMDFLEGYIDMKNPSNRTNLSFLHRINFDTTDDVWRFQREFEERYSSFGGKVIAQRFNDVGRSIFSPLPNNTTLTDYFIGNIFNIIPEKSGFVLLEAINKFDKLMEGRVVDNDTVIIAPEIGNFWPEIETDKSFRTNVPGIFVAGDALGFIRGALQGSVTGIKTANAIRRFL